MADKSPLFPELFEGLPEDWRGVPFSHAVFFQEGPGLRNWQYRNEGIPFVNIRCLVNGRLDREAMSCLDVEEVNQKYSHFLLDAGDYVVSSSGTIGRVAEVYVDDLPCMLNTSVIRMRPEIDELDRRFLRYFLSSTLFQRQIESIAVGSAQLNYGPSHLKKMWIVLPPISEQHSIAKILGALDDKIELNRRMNATLEAMAQAVFKEWFVDGAKEEWKRKTIGELADIVGGSTPSTKKESYWTDGIHCWATPKDLSSLTVPVLLDTERHLSDAGLAEVGSGLLPIGTVLLSSRAPIGYIAIAEVATAVNQGFIALKAKPGVSNLFLWQWIRQSMDEIKNRANGSTFQEISKANFRPITLRVPPPERMKAYDTLVRPMYERLVANERESRTLAALRDTLLPKLMRGEVRVKEKPTSIAAQH
ncbi:MAG: restriction endonuclease subunit S [Flavobacteriales bacterium]|nr:restriction endonuclease subunit S [Flavobacteriales bacterium]